MAEDERCGIGERLSKNVGRKQEDTFNGSISYKERCEANVLLHKEQKRRT